MTVDPGDRLVSMEVLSHGQTLFAVTENGFGKRTSIDEYPVHNRGGKGVISIKTSQRNGNVVAIMGVEEEDDVMLMTNIGKVIRTRIREISVISRNTQGVKLMDVDVGERVVGAARLAEKEDEDGAGAGARRGPMRSEAPAGKRRRIGVVGARELGDGAGRPARAQRASRWTSGRASPRSWSRSTRGMKTGCFCRASRWPKP